MLPKYAMIGTEIHTTYRILTGAPREQFSTLNMYQKYKESFLVYICLDPASRQLNQKLESLSPCIIFCLVIFFPLHMIKGLY